MKFGSQFTFVLAAGKNLKTVARVRRDNFLLRPGKFQREDATDLAIYNFDERKFRGEGPGEEREHESLDIESHIPYFSFV